MLEIKRNNNLINIDLHEFQGYALKVYELDELIDKSRYTFEEDHLLVETVKPQYKVVLSTPKCTNIYFERTIMFERTNNFRDFGGYPSKFGGYVCLNRLFRSDQLSKLSTQDIEDFAHLPITNIIDYRSSSEIAKAPDPDFNIKIHNLNPKVEMAERASEEVETKKKQGHPSTLDMLLEEKYHPQILKLSKFMKDMFIHFPRNKESIEAYKKVLRVYLQSDGAVLQHCKGGKDRTGYGVALILMILGVKREDIIYDFLLTNENKYEENENKMKQYREITNNQELLQNINTMMSVHESYLINIMDYIDSVGGIERYCKKILDFSGKDIELFRNKYITR